MVDKHFFDVSVAMSIGVSEAIVLEGLKHWTHYNQSNGYNFKFGKTWVHNTYAAWTKLFPYFSEKQIRCVLRKLVVSGFIVAENLNEDKRDRTLWYAITEKGMALLDGKEWRSCSCDQTGRADCPNGQTTDLDGAETSAQMGRCLSNTNKYSFVPVEYNSRVPSRVKTLFDVHAHAREMTDPVSGAVVPTLEDVRSYCNARKNKIVPEQFIAYYAARRWSLGGGVPITDWEALVRLWETRERKWKGCGESSAAQSSFDVDEFFNLALQKSYADLENRA